MLSYWTVKLLSYFACLLPHRVAMMLGAGLARLLWPFIPARRKRLARRQRSTCLCASAAFAYHLQRQHTSRVRVRCALDRC